MKGEEIEEITEFQRRGKRIKELEAENVRLKEEIAAWEKRFPTCGYDGNSIVLCG